MSSALDFVISLLVWMTLTVILFYECNLQQNYLSNPVCLSFAKIQIS